MGPELGFGKVPPLPPCLVVVAVVGEWAPVSLQAKAFPQYEGDNPIQCSRAPYKGIRGPGIIVPILRKRRLRLSKAAHPRLTAGRRES